jgi:vancomycin aglycone glucosyltransferase
VKAAALAGVPQVVIPNHYDQHYWAQRVHTLGIGVAHAAGAPTRDSLADALAESLRPGEVGFDSLLTLSCLPPIPTRID